MFSRENLRQLMHILDPIRNRIANTVAKAVIQRVQDDTQMQLVQVGILKGEDREGYENYQGFGFNSVPLRGAECVVVFPNGDRGVGLVVATADREFRPTDWKDGEAGNYNAFGLQSRLRDNGDIEVGLIGGTFKALAFKSDVDAVDSRLTTHAHPTTATINGGGAPGVIAPTTTPPATIVGTANIKGT
jgi:phage baseplate assembly protein V